jgi:beta-galactosidase
LVKNKFKKIFFYFHSLFLGQFLYDPKGITENVLLNNIPLLNWSHFPLSLSSEQISLITFTTFNDSNNFGVSNTPAFYKFFLFVDTLADTFLDISGWNKGHVFVNGFNLGSYWDPVNFIYYFFFIFLLFLL